MNRNQKLGLGFVVTGLLIILLFYFVASETGFLFAASIGLMAIAFGGFQLLLSKPVSTQTSKAAKARKTARRH